AAAAPKCKTSTVCSNSSSRRKHCSNSWAARAAAGPEACSPGCSRAEFGASRAGNGGDVMAVRIRLKRMGAKKRPFYRLVVADSRSARDGRVIETLGHYDPMTDPIRVSVNVERARLWLSRGAQPSETARRLLRQAGVFEESSEALQAPSAETAQA